MNKFVVKDMINHYILSLDLKGEHKDNIISFLENSYFKQLEHFLDMNEKISKLKPFSKTLFFSSKRNRTLTSDSFKFENEEDLFNKVVSSVNESFNKTLKMVGI